MYQSYLMFACNLLKSYITSCRNIKNSKISFPLAFVISPMEKLNIAPLLQNESILLCCCRSFKDIRETILSMITCSMWTSVFDHREWLITRNNWMTILTMSFTLGILIASAESILCEWDRDIFISAAKGGVICRYLSLCCVSFVTFFIEILNFAKQSPLRLPFLRLLCLLYWQIHVLLYISL